MKKIFMLLGMLFSITTGFSQNIIKAEYFIDLDPGPGNGKAIPGFAQGAIVNFNFDISTSDLPLGFHFLNTRVADADGKWSRYETRIFYLSSAPTTNTTNITGAEYFIDSDTVTGSGIPINIGSPGPLVNFTVLIPAGLSPGFHSLGIRVKDEEGKWSLFEERSFYLSGDGSDAPPIVAAEYFYDADPGIGSASPLDVSPTGNIITQTFFIPVPGSLSQGEHVLAIRVKDQQGHWSFIAKDTISVSNSATISCPSNTVVAASPGQCTAIVNNIDPIVAPVGASYTYTLTGATIGTGTGTASGKTFNAGVTTVTYALNSSPTTTCSFTVTVNANVAPSVSISQSPTTICSGTIVTFTASPVNGGSAPTYQWKVNDINVGNNSNTYTPSTPVNGNVVKVIMTSSLGCANPLSATSNSITMVVNDSIQEYVSITASAITICAGTTVTFAAAESGSGSGTFQWKLNGNNVGTNSLIYRTDSLHDGDKVKVVFTPTYACSPSQVTSNEITITVNSALTPSVSILASATNICSGQQVTFNAAPVNGGATPSYQWKLNGNNVGSNSPIYQNSTLQNGDSVRVVMTSSLGSVCQPTASSNSITMSVAQTVIPSVSIISSATTICSGQSVTFTATPTNGGNNPNYEWILNNNVVGSNSNAYQSSTLQNGDVIKVTMESSLGCANPRNVYSNTIVMTVGSGVTPLVSISASAIDICAGQQVTFTATPTNGGNSPTYQWKLNGNNVGSNSATYQTASLANADTIKVVMTSSLSCASSLTAISNSISMDVSASVLPSVGITADLTYICQGELVTFTATPTNGGNPTYQWKLNGNNVGTNSNFYQSTSFGNNDSVEVVMTSSLGCASPQAVTSNNIFMTVTTAVTPQVSIAASATSVCAGTLVTFTATPTNGGTPSYQWKLNGNNVGIDYYKYENSNLSAGDVISVTMTTTLSCVTTSTAVSNSITMTPVSSLITYYRDLDEDGYGNAASGTLQACEPTSGYVASNTDCNDNSGTVHPGAPEVCGNNIDDDCDGQVDESCPSSPDNDNDNYTVAQGDCNDNNAAVHPGATEACGNNVDDDCDGQTDEGCNATTLPVIILRTYPVKEGDAGQTILNVEVNLDIPAPFPVSVQYSTVNDDAVAGSDYVATNGVLEIPAGTVSGSIQVRIIGDLLRESNERFRINFTNPVNAALNGEPYSRIMIIDNDKGKNNNNAAARNDQPPVKEEVFKIPTITRRNQVWVIPQIGNYENEVLIVNVQGQVVNKFVNYKNQAPIANVSTGLYFYRIRITERPGQYKYYSGRVMITE